MSAEDKQPRMENKHKCAFFEKPEHPTFKRYGRYMAAVRVNEEYDENFLIGALKNRPNKESTNFCYFCVLKGDEDREELSVLIPKYMDRMSTEKTYENVDVAAIIFVIDNNAKDVLLDWLHNFQKVEERIGKQIAKKVEELSKMKKDDTRRSGHAHGILSAFQKPPKP